MDRDLLLLIYLGIGLIHWLVWSIWNDYGRWLHRPYMPPGERILMFLIFQFLWPIYWVVYLFSTLLTLWITRPWSEKTDQ